MSACLLPVPPPGARVSSRLAIQQTTQLAFSSNTFVCKLSFWVVVIPSLQLIPGSEQLAGFILHFLFALLCNDRCIGGVIIEDLDACFKVKARNMEECLSRPVLCCPWDKIKWFDRSPFNCGEKFHSCLFLYLETALKAKNATYF